MAEKIYAFLPNPDSDNNDWSCEGISVYCLEKDFNNAMRLFIDANSANFDADTIFDFIRETYEDKQHLFHDLMCGAFDNAWGCPEDSIHFLHCIKAKYKFYGDLEKEILEVINCVLNLIEQPRSVSHE